MEQQPDYTECIQRYLNGTATHEDLLDLLNWVKQSSEHIQYFNQICRLWEEGSAVSISEHQTELALLRLQNRIKASQSNYVNSSLQETKKSYRLKLLIRIAAVISGIVLIISSLLFVKNRGGNDGTQLFTTAIASPGQKSQLVLLDGTVVWLNSGSRLRYSSVYGQKKREVYLEGEGFFKVAKNADLPFLVHASSLVVKALGTSFNVKCYSEDPTVETTLVEGKVEINEAGAKTNQSPKVILAPSEKLTFSKSTQSAMVTKYCEPGITSTAGSEIKCEGVSIETVISWKEQILVFENESFTNLVKKLERWYDVKIMVQNKNLLKNFYTGKFANHESVEQILTVISRTTPLHFTIDKKTIKIE